MHIDGKVAVVTGAAGGIGEAVAHRLAAHGAAIAALDVDAVRLRSVVDRIVAGGGRSCALPMDVGDSSAVDEAVDCIERDFGSIDLLVNVAGVLHSSPIIELSDADWAEVFAVNLHGVLHCSRAVARRMIPRRSGVIVTVGSNAAAVARMGLSAYSASKAAAATLTKCLGLELAQYGIRCNVVSPGSTNTGMLRTLLGEGNDNSTAIVGSLDKFRVGIPLCKVAEPEDIADVVAFMASSEAGHLTMQELFVDGGATLRL